MITYSMAQEIIALHEENAQLRGEVARLQRIEAEYGQQVVEGIKHGEMMMLGWLDLLLSDKVKIIKPGAVEELC